MAARYVDESVIGGHRPGDPSPRSIAVTETVFDAHVLHASRKLSSRGNGSCCIVGMAQLVDMQRFDFVLAPAEQICPCGVGAEEVAIEVRDAKQIFGHLPDAIAFTGALRYFRFKTILQDVQRFFISHSLGGLGGGGKHAADTTG